MAAQVDFISGMMSLMKVVVNGNWIDDASSLAEVAPVTWNDDISCPDIGPDYFQENEGSLTLSHYADGRIRRENVDSGVIQEERPGGGLTVSLPDGKILTQDFEGSPLLVTDLENPGPPWLGRITTARIEEEPSPVYYYQDAQNGHYIVELSTLRHFQIDDADFLGA